ncbi:MAG TPA: hypothetical protein VF527_06555 [Pyrinomonadaceae bacterium]|jgi:hypothetical protein
MNKEDAKVLGRKFLMLAVLLGCLFVATSSWHETVYASGCTDCSEAYYDCVSGCNSNSACIQYCQASNDTCFNFCTSEGGGSSGGGVANPQCQTRNSCCNACVQTRSLCWAEGDNFDDELYQACRDTGRTTFQCCNIGYQECISHCP